MIFYFFSRKIIILEKNCLQNLNLFLKELASRIFYFSIFPFWNLTGDVTAWTILEKFEAINVKLWVHIEKFLSVIAWISRGLLMIITWNFRVLLWFSNKAKRHFLMCFRNIKPPLLSIVVTNACISNLKLKSTRILESREATNI